MSRLDAFIPCTAASAVPSARESCVPEPRPECLGMDSFTSRRTFGLRTGTQARVLGNGFFYFQTDLRVDVIVFRETGNRFCHAILFQAEQFQLARIFRFKDYIRMIHSYSDASIKPSKITVQVYQAEVQARRRLYRKFHTISLLIS